MLFDSLFRGTLPRHSCLCRRMPRTWLGLSIELGTSSMWRLEGEEEDTMHKLQGLNGSDRVATALPLTGQHECPF